MDALIFPLQFDFMVKAIIVSSLVGAVCALLSCFLVLKRWSLMGDAVSHSVLPGVVLAYTLGIPFSIGAFVFGLGSVLGIGYIKQKVRLKDDAVIGIVFTTLFALGLVLVSKVPSNIDLMHILFGYVLGISNADAWQVGIIALTVITVLLVLRRSLLLYAFDQAHMKAIRLKVNVYHYLLLVLLALTVVASVQTVGIILVLAMLIGRRQFGLDAHASFEQLECRNRSPKIAGDSPHRRQLRRVRRPCSNDQGVPEIESDESNLGPGHGNNR